MSKAAGTILERELTVESLRSTEFRRTENFISKSGCAQSAVLALRAGRALACRGCSEAAGGARGRRGREAVSKAKHAVSSAGEEVVSKAMATAAQAGLPGVNQAGAGNGNGSGILPGIAGVPPDGPGPPGAVKRP